MSEVAVSYQVVGCVGTCLWRCRNCGYELAAIVDGEAWVTGKVIFGKGGWAAALCPRCGAANKWLPTGNGQR